MIDSFIGRAWYDNGREYWDKSWGNVPVDPFIARVDKEKCKVDVQTPITDELSVCITMAISEYYKKKLKLDEPFEITNNTNKKILVILKYYHEDI